jgi:hypothetical protein
MKYRHTPYDFQLETVPLSIGALSAVFKNASYIDIGSLFDDIKDRLHDTPLVRANKYRFSLVNVCCTHSGFSFGVLDTPPKRARALNGPWLYTFAIDGTGYMSTDGVSRVSLLGIDAKLWSPGDGGNFLTISTKHHRAMELGLVYDSLTPRYVYYMLGMITKNLLLNNKEYVAPAPISNLSARSTLYMMPLASVLGRIPFTQWKYNRHVWNQCPGLIAPSTISDDFMVYYCANIYHGALPAVLEATLRSKLLQGLIDAQSGIPNLTYYAFANRDQLTDMTDLEGMLQGLIPSTPLPTFDEFQRSLDKLFSGQS